MQIQRIITIRLQKDPEQNDIRVPIYVMHSGDKRIPSELLVEVIQVITHSN